MLASHSVGKLAIGGLFTTASEFDFSVRRCNQDNGKLLKLARRNKSRIQHICLLQARENERFTSLNKGKKRTEDDKPQSVCSGVWIAIKRKPKTYVEDCQDNIRAIVSHKQGY